MNYIFESHGRLVSVTPSEMEKAVMYGCFNCTSLEPVTFKFHPPKKEESIAREMSTNYEK